MCGRFALATQAGFFRAEIRALPGYPQVNVQDWVGQDNFIPRYNIAPNTQAPVIRRGDTGTAINARSENLVEGVGMWNKFRGRNRCIVVCQGYYEWQTKGKAQLPHFIRHSSPDKIMLMAGLYESTIEKGDVVSLPSNARRNERRNVPLTDSSEPTYTFAIVTTDASKGLSWLHDRQPVILSSVEDVMRWLDTSSQTWSAELANLLHPWEDVKAPLECYQVPKEVGKVGAESPTFIQPLSTRKDGIQAMFAKQRTKQEATAKRKREPSSPVPGKSDEIQTEEKKVKRES
ncbi:hypothetical protein F5141DRAFT_1194616 [Pisolithus sp. B1]|nr:hypothetical protein F5141DRAFT_1194616 [Pisolithus sp. B1]